MSRATNLTASDLPTAADVLRRGELVAVPTETVYGLAGIAYDPTALAAIFAAKGRPTFDPLILHIGRNAPSDGPWDALRQSGAVELDEPHLPAAIVATLRRVVEAAWPGPLTIVLPRTPRVPDLATSGLPTVAVRMPDHPLLLRLLAELGQPLAAPSANRFGSISPTSAGDVAMELGDRIPYILDGGPCRVGVESTILRVPTAASDPWEILRLGGTPTDRLAGWIGAEPIVRTASSAPGQPAAAPGMLSRHYAPRTPLTLRPVDNLAAAIGSATRLGWLRFADTPAAEGDTPAWVPAGARIIATETLPRSSEAAAVRLFAALRSLDGAGCDRIIADPPPDPAGPLSAAILDRLRRAAAAE